MASTAIIAGTGALPALLAGALARSGERPVLAALEGMDCEVPGLEPIRFRVENLVPFLERLTDMGVRRVIFGGAVRRPYLDLRAFDPKTAQLVPRLSSAMQDGDDATLREVIAIFEEQGLKVVGAHALAPELVPEAGRLCGAPPSEADMRDAERAAGIVEALGAVDVGQSAVVAQGLCLAIEALPGTDAMLDFVAATGGALRPDPEGAKGILYKAPKPGQERRVDLPALGPTTVEKAARAGLAGIVWEAGGVLCIDRARMIEIAEREGLFLWAREAR